MFSGIKGRLRRNYPLHKAVWFRAGGLASFFFNPYDREDLKHFLQQNTFPLFTLGAGSNTLFRDTGFEGAVLRLTAPAFTSIHFFNETVVVGAGCLNKTVVLSMADHGLSSLEFLVGIPGTIGGSIKMNAGAYGHEIKDALLWVDVMTQSGYIERISSFKMTYRSSHLPDNLIILCAAFSCVPRPQDDIQNVIQTYMNEKEKTQPIRGRTGGSTFKNLPHQKAWELIDLAGCRGLRVGAVHVSEKHCNFLINEGENNAADIEKLGEIVQQRVYEKTQQKLEWEVLRVG